jgi:hypothetical protein
VKADDVVCEGVSFSAQHLLTVPSNQEIGDALQTNDDVHKLIKETKHGDEFIIETIEEFRTLDTFFTTGLLQNRTLCYLTTGVLGFGGGTPGFRHCSIKRVIITRHKGRCPHDNHALNV